MTNRITGSLIQSAVESYDAYRQTGLSIGEARKLVSQEFQISLFSLAKASKVRGRSPELFQHVVEGRSTLSSAYKEVHKPRSTRSEDQLVRESAPKPSRLSRRQLEVLSSIAGTAKAIAQTCTEVNVETALLAAEPSHQREFERALKEASVAINQVRRELRLYAR